MIKNEKQYRTAKNQLKKLNLALEASINTTVEMPKEIYEVMIAGIQSQIDEIELDIEKYESLRDAEVLSIDSINELGQFLIEARVARGYSQRELAEKIGKKTQQIQKYETLEYKSASLAKIAEIAKALEVDDLATFINLTKHKVCVNLDNWFLNDNIVINTTNTKSTSEWSRYRKQNKNVTSKYYRLAS